MEERILGIEDTIEKMNISVKENVKSRAFDTKDPENLIHSEKNKP